MRIFKLTVREACTGFFGRPKVGHPQSENCSLFIILYLPLKTHFSGSSDVKKDLANSLFQIFCILLLCPCPPRSCPPVKRIMFCTSQLRFSTMHCFEFLCNVYVENLTERQHFGNIFPKGRQILGQFIFTFLARLKVRLLFPELLIAHKNLGTLYLPAPAMRHWHLNCEVIRKHNPSLSEKNRKRIHA